MQSAPKTSVLFLCLGNICRSPLAEGVFRAAVKAGGRSDAFAIDSAGTGAWHAGEGPDPRSVGVAADNGLDISMQVARKLRASDYTQCDWIVAMDRSNLSAAKERAPQGSRARLVKFMDYVPEAMGGGPDVPDPYYGGPGGFQRVYDLLDAGMPGLLAAMASD